MSLRYLYSTTDKNRRNSIIEYNGSTFSPLTNRPLAGYTSYTRFFGTSSEQRQFVVKQPKLDSLKKDKLAAVISAYTKSYELEQLVWNLLYPSQKAQLFTEGGPRLILPRLPGGTLSENLSENPLTRCQQAFAVAYALQRLYELGWAHNDLNQDNVLIEQKSDGSFQAYLIDFDRASKIDEYNSNSDLLYLSSLVYVVPNLRRCGGYRCFDSFITDLLSEINRLRELGQDTYAIRSGQKK